VKISKKKIFDFFAIAWLEPCPRSVSHVTLYSPNRMELWPRNGLKLTRKIRDSAFRWVFDSNYHGSFFISGYVIFPIVLHAFYTGWLDRVVCWSRYRFRSFRRVEFSGSKISTLTFQLPGVKRHQSCQNRWLISDNLIE